MQLRAMPSDDLAGKVVLVRCGFDVPLEDGVVHDTTRLELCVPTIRQLSDAGAKVVLLSHQGRPKGKRDEGLSLRVLVDSLTTLLGQPVSFCEEAVGALAQEAVDSLENGAVLLLENLRFYPGEKENDAVFTEQLAALGDLYVNEAFAVCHRAHASMDALARALPSYAGLQLQEEVTRLQAVLDDPKQPLTLIMSGAKLETKIPVIKKFLPIADTILLGGGISNTFLKASGFDIGASLHDDTALDLARDLMLESEQDGQARIVLPTDVMVATDLDHAAEAIDLPVEDIEGDMQVFDIGRNTAAHYCDIVRSSASVLWNGPLGKYETDAFARGSIEVATCLAEATESGCSSILGGGDTLDLLKKGALHRDEFSFVSSGGGAMISFLSGDTLPALVPLQ